MIWLISILAFVIRIINLNQSLWLDEATQAILSSMSIYSIWFDRAADFHPPLSYFLYHFWIQLGTSETWLRILPVLFGVGTIFIIYKLVQKIFNQKTAILSTLFLAIAPYHIYYSQEVRMYSFAAFFAALSMYFFVELKKEPKNRLGYILSTGALIYTHYLGFFLILAQVFYLIWIKKENLKVFLQNLLVVLLFWMPWFPQFLKQLQSGVNVNQYLPGWGDILSVSPIKALPLTLIKFTIGRIDFESVIIYAIVAIITLSIVCFLLFEGLINLRKPQQLIVFWFLVPIILAIIFSFKIPLNQPFRLLFVLPAFYILISVGILSFGKHWKIALGTMILISLAGLGFYYFNQRFWREDWRGATNFVNSRISENDLALFVWGEPFPPYTWYQGRNGVGVIRQFPATEEQVRRSINFDKVSAIYYFEYLQELSDPDKIAEKTLKKNGFFLNQINDFRGVGFINYYIR